MSYIELIYIDSDHAARKTDVYWECDTPEQTWAMFRSARPLAASKDEMDFLLDYYNRKGDLADTIGITSADLERLTGHKRLPEQHYCEVDRAFWQRVTDEMRGAKASTTQAINSVSTKAGRE